MRTILCLSLLLALGAGLGTARASLPEMSPIVSETRALPGSTILSIEDGSEDPFAKPTLQLVALPPGAGIPQVRLLPGDGAADGADLTVSAGRPMVMRGLRLVPVTVAPVPDRPAKAGVARPRMARIEIRYEENAAATGVRAQESALRCSRGFFNSLAGRIPADQMSQLESSVGGSYVIVTDPNFLSAVEPFAEWKRAQGFEVFLVTTDETGRQNRDIRNYVLNLYQTSPRPPQYLLLVGDSPDVSFTGGIPGYDYHQIISDHPYSLLDGDDFLPDIHVGRIPVRSLDGAQTAFAKILRHEQNPYTEGGTEWFSRGLVVAGDYGSVTPRPVSRWCREQLLDIGFAAVDSVYYPPWWSDHLQQRLIPGSINRGVSIVSYRGWAYGIHGWEPPHFTSLEIDGLTNGWMLPVVFSFVCQNNDFREPTCFGEAWIRAGSAASPKGAVAVIGNSEPWSHTRFNDVAAIGAFEAIHKGTRKLGEILDAFKMGWLLQFPTEIPYEGSEKESVEFYFHMYNLLGDPDLEIWTDAPREITVAHADPIPLGSNVVEVSVHAVDGNAAVAGARVGISQGETTLGVAWTGADGIARVPVSGLAQTSDPVIVTATGAGVDPYTGSAAVGIATTFLTLGGVEVDDDNDGASHGNADGIPNPGEALELRITLRNTGSQAATGVGASLAAAPGFTVTTATATFPDIAAGATAVSNDPFVVEVAADAEDALIGRLTLTATASGTPSVSTLAIEVAGTALRHESTVIDGDGVLMPDETAGLTVRLRNEGSVASSSVSAILRSLSPGLVAVLDSAATFVEQEGSGIYDADRPFTLHAGAEAGIGQVAVLTLLLTTIDGQTSETSFSVTVGSADHSAPLGPDAYGYYAYDVTDTDYPDTAPTFDYVNCSTVYGGSGTKLPLNNNSIKTVDLPFTFTYYGHSYDRVAVSDNGWIAFDTSHYYDYYNWHMPNTYGSAAQVAPFWDNLDPSRKLDPDHPIPMADGVYTFFDAANHRFLVEWSRIPNFIPQYDDVQTFEVILYDPAYRSTPTGDGVIEFQYKSITNNDADRMYATVGIENETEDVGLEYSYSNVYATAAGPLGAGLAIRFTTEGPRYDPPGLARFDAAPTGGGVFLEWEPKDERPFSGFRVYRQVHGASQETVVAERLGVEARSFLDEGADPNTEIAYTIGWIDPYGRETRVGPFPYGGKDAAQLALAVGPRTPNPFRGSLDLTYGVPASGPAELRVHDLAGRLVRTLVSGPMGRGIFTASWDGKDDEGRDLPSGVYLCKLTAGRESRSLKLTLVR